MNFKNLTKAIINTSKLPVETYIGYSSISEIITRDLIRLPPTATCMKGNSFNTGGKEVGNGIPCSTRPQMLMYLLLGLALLLLLRLDDMLLLSSSASSLDDRELYFLATGSDKRLLLTKST